MFTGIHVFWRTREFWSSPAAARCYLCVVQDRFAASGRDALIKMAAYGVMASDGIETKVPSQNGLDLEHPGDIADETASVIELSGAIKWFDVSKGYGFIVPDNGMPDILLHVTCLRRDGFQVAYEGARVVCEVLQRPRGLHAFRPRCRRHELMLSSPRRADSSGHRSNGSIVCADLVF